MYAAIFTIQFSNFAYNLTHVQYTLPKTSTNVLKCFLIPIKPIMLTKFKLQFNLLSKYANKSKDAYRWKKKLVFAAINTLQLDNICSFNDMNLSN